jgi:hypothetical protein
MEWPGRAPACQYEKLARGAQDKKHTMSQKLNAAIAVIGIDIGKNSFHIVGHDHRGVIVLRQKWARGRSARREQTEAGIRWLCRMSRHVGAGPPDVQTNDPASAP